MKTRYRLYRRGQMFYSKHTITGKQETLATKDRTVAQRLLHSKNEAHLQPTINLQIARAYLAASDPEIAKRTWQIPMNEIVKLKHSDTQRRWLAAIKDKAFDSIRDLPILQTRPEHFLRVLESGKVSANVYLRRIHNFALSMNWLPGPVLPKNQWPKIRFKEKRGITLAEHTAIVGRENNPERRSFYELAWHLGASQSDIAFLKAENIDWENRVISYARKKTGQVALVRFGREVEGILRSVPSFGPLLPYAPATASNRQRLLTKPEWADNRLAESVLLVGVVAAQATCLEARVTPTNHPSMRAEIERRRFESLFCLFISVLRLIVLFAGKSLGSSSSAKLPLRAPIIFVLPVLRDRPRCLVQPLHVVGQTHDFAGSKIFRRARHRVA